ncbi:hypothetical protein, partial [Micrococcus luteus]|uniref:hypothetical protein n=1 Tax=Micrococcus luteus TaxID=1270 RepID=UPI001C92F18D
KKSQADNKIMTNNTSTTPIHHIPNSLLPYSLLTNLLSIPSLKFHHYHIHNITPLLTSTPFFSNLPTYDSPHNSSFTSPPITSPTDSPIFFFT